jgi:hypothetical protein
VVQNKQMDALIIKYIATLDEPALIGLRVAREVFGKNFRIEETQGFKEWLATPAPAPAPGV